MLLRIEFIEIAVSDGECIIVAPWHTRQVWLLLRFEVDAGETVERTWRVRLLAQRQ
jgi:hypothetical protein